MHIHSDKKSESKSYIIAERIPTYQFNNEQTVQFTDNRPEAFANQSIMEAMNNSQEVRQLAVYQKIANNSLQTKQISQLEELTGTHTTHQHPPIQRKENNTGLPHHLKSGIESLSGYSMDDVKVHYNSDKPSHVQAHAYAQGTEIHIASGQEKHLPHEAWHVVQQKQGRVKPTMQLKRGIQINDSDYLEKEADVMGSKAIAAGRSGIKNNGSGAPVQRHSYRGRHIIQRVLYPGDQAPTMGQMLSKRFINIIIESKLHIDSQQLLTSMQDTLTAYSNNAPILLVTNDDCAMRGIQQALQANSLNNVSNLPLFFDMAKMFSLGHVLQLGLNQDDVDHIIEDRLKIALHDALKNVANESINDVSGITEIRNVIRNNTNGLTIPPQNAQQLFCIALRDQLLVQPITTIHSYQQFKTNVLTHRIATVTEQYFDTIPGTLRERMQILRMVRRFGPQRFQVWEREYLQKTHKGLADVQTALTTVNVPNNMDITSASNSYQSVLNETGNQHLLHHPQNPAFINELTQPNKIALVHLLKNMPVVKAMLETHGTTLNDNNGHHTWHDPNVLVSSDNNVSYHEARQIMNPGHKMQVRIREALRKINNLVSANLLNNTNTPNIVLHKDLGKLQSLLQEKYDNFFGFRAFAMSQGHQVNVGLDEKIQLIMHEMGHLIEDNMGTKEWLDIQSLLHMRHANAAPDNRLSHVYTKGFGKLVSFAFPSQARNEPAYQAEMPATGPYSAKYYDSGSTEVMSVTIEHFGNRENARNLIENDPLQAAIILRIIQPEQFHQFVEVPFPNITGMMP